METGERGPLQGRLRGLTQTFVCIFGKPCSENDNDIIRSVNWQKAVSFSRIDTAKKNQSVTASDSAKVKQSITAEPTDVIVNEAKCADHLNSMTFDGTSGYSVNVDNGATCGYNMHPLLDRVWSDLQTTKTLMIMYENSVTDTA